MKFNTLLILVGAFFMASCGTSTTESFPTEPETFVDPGLDEDSLRALFQSAYELGAFNGSVMVCKNGRPVFEEHYGVTDASGQDTLSRNSAYRLASVSKNYTAAGILRLCQQGRCDLDAPVQQFMPDFPYPGVTPRHLLTHTSGIPDLYLDVAESNRALLEPVLTTEEVVAMVVHGGWEAVPPGTVHEYSNTGYVFLAGLIEHISGKSFEQFMAEEIFTPLNMANTRVWNLESESETFAGKTTGFEWIQAQRQPIAPLWIDGVAGDGAVFTSTADAVTWEGFWRGNNLVSDSLLKQAFEPYILQDGDTAHYGFGWDLGTGVQFHEGGWLGAVTYMLRIPDERTLAVIFSNSADEERFQELVVALDLALGVDE